MYALDNVDNSGQPLARVMTLVLTTTFTAVLDGGQGLALYIALYIYDTLDQYCRSCPWSL